MARGRKTRIRRKGELPIPPPSEFGASPMTEALRRRLPEFTRELLQMERDGVRSRTYRAKLQAAERRVNYRARDTIRLTLIEEELEPPPS